MHTLQQHQWALLKAIGVIEEDKGTRRRGKVSRELPNPDMFYDNIPDMPGSLGARLEDMNKDLLTVRNATWRGGNIVWKGGITSITGELDGKRRDLSFALLQREV